MKIRCFLPSLILGGAQFLGLLSVLTWQLMPFSIRSGTWAIGVVALFPGNFLAAVLVNKIFWQSALSNTSLSVIGFSMTFAINAVIWLIVFRTVQALRRGKLRRQQIKPR